MNGLYLRNYVSIRSDEMQYLNQTNVYFIDVYDTTKAWLSNAGNFPTPESRGDPDIALIDWEANPSTVNHKGYYAVINDTLWDPQVHTIQQFNDCYLRVIPIPDTITTVGQVELVWHKPIEDPGVPDTTNIVGYNVYRGHNGIDFPIRLNTGLVIDTFYIDNTSIGDSVYYYALKLVYRGTPDTIGSRYFSANSPMIKANYDIALISIDSPTDSIEPDSIKPIISIKNTGRMTSYNFYIRCSIDSSSSPVYSESLLVDSLPPDSFLSLTFPFWHLGPGGNTYIVNGINLLSSDANSLNDSLTKTVVIYLHDVGIDSLISPADTINVGQAINPTITVKNYGNTAESFPAYCYIDSSGSFIYSETLFVDSLKPDSIKLLTFPSWTPLGEGNYTFYFITQLSGDVNPANDTIIFMTYATGIEEASNSQFSISNYQLSVYPNPFTQKTVIKWTLGTGHSVSGENPITNDQCPMTISIYDVSGRLVRNLSLGTGHSTPGTEVMWDGTDDKGKLVSAGIYFIRFKAGNYKRWKKIVLIR